MWPAWSVRSILEVETREAARSQTGKGCSCHTEEFGLYPEEWETWKDFNWGERWWNFCWRKIILGNILAFLGKSFSPLKNRANGLDCEIGAGEIVFGSSLSPLELTLRKGILFPCDSPWYTRSLDHSGLSLLLGAVWFKRVPGIPCPEGTSSEIGKTRHTWNQNNKAWLGVIKWTG